MSLKKYFYILMFTILLELPTATYSSGMFLGSDLYKSCKAFKEHSKESSSKKNNKESAEDIIKEIIFKTGNTTTCISYIDAIYEMTVLNTDLVQNKSLKNVKRNMTSTEEFFITHKFCVPNQLSNEQLVLSVINYIEDQLKENNKSILYIPAVEVILYSFHANFPCEL